MMAVPIRLARADEAQLVRQIEDRAGERYAEAGLPSDLEGIPLDEIATAQADGFLWVTVENDQPVGFALCWLRPDALHLRELNIHPDRMGQGLGRGLVEHVVQEASRRGLPRVTLTTFRDVPWNAPLYRRWSFVELSSTELPGWLREIRQEEDAGELRRWPRVAMAREVF